MLSALPFICCESAVSQDYTPDPWDALVARGNQVLDCRAAGQEKIAEPLAAASDLYRSALTAVDHARADSEEEGRRLGAFRANAVKSLSDVETQLRQWRKAYATAGDAYAKSRLNEARSALLTANPLPCSLDAQKLQLAIDRAKHDLDGRLADGLQIQFEAQSSFDLKAAVALYQKAIKRLTEAQMLNVEDPRPAAAILACKRFLEVILSPSKTDVLVLTNPGGARVIVRNGSEPFACEATPCIFHFERAFFDKSGGPFWESRRLTSPLMAVASKEGYRTTTIGLTDSPRHWTQSVPGRVLSELYYVISKNRFEIHLVGP